MKAYKKITGILKDADSLLNAFSIEPYEIPAIKAYLSRFLGKKLEFFWRTFRKDRSNEQNRYMWGVPYDLIAYRLGWTTDEVHEYCKARFLKEPDEPGRPGKIQSTADLSTVEFEEYMTKIRQWAAVGFPDEHGESDPFYAPLNIPEPNQVAFL